MARVRTTLVTTTLVLPWFYTPGTPLSLLRRSDVCRTVIRRGLKCHGAHYYTVTLLTGLFGSIGDYDRGL